MENRLSSLRRTSRINAAYAIPLNMMNRAPAFRHASACETACDSPGFTTSRHADHFAGPLDQHRVAICNPALDSSMLWSVNG